MLSWPHYSNFHQVGYNNQRKNHKIAKCARRNLRPKIIWQNNLKCAKFKKGNFSTTTWNCMWLCIQLTTAGARPLSSSRELWPLQMLTLLNRMRGVETEVKRCLLVTRFGPITIQHTSQRRLHRAAVMVPGSITSGIIENQESCRAVLSQRCWNHEAEKPHNYITSHWNCFRLCLLQTHEGEIWI